MKRKYNTQIVLTIMGNKTQ